MTGAEFMAGFALFLASIALGVSVAVWLLIVFGDR
jgi:hypothetical protein